MNPRSGVCCIALCLPAVASAAVDLSAMNFRTVAVSGQALPGSPTSAVFTNSVTFGVWATPTLSHSGLVMLPQPSGLYLRDALTGGPLTRYVAGGTPLLGENTSESGHSAPGYEAPMFPQMDAAGHIIGGSPGQTDSIVNKITSAIPGSAILGARSHTAVPGMSSSQLWESLGFPTVQPDGTTRFFARVGNGDERLFTWNGATTTPTQLMGAYEPAPGMPGYTLETLIRSTSQTRQGPVINASGQMVLFGHLDTATPGVTFNNRDVLWKGGAGSLSPVMRRGTNLPNGDLVRLIDNDFEINGAGDLVGTIQAGSNPSSWGKQAVIRNGVITYLAQGGQQGPGLNPGEVWGGNGQFGDAVMNHSGNVAFAGVISPLNGYTGVWFGNEASLQMIVRPGLVIPDFGAGLSVLTAYRGLALNADDDLILQVRLAGAGVPYDTFGLVHWSPDTGLQGLLKTGDQIQVSPGVFKTLSYFALATGSGGEDGRASCLDDRRDLAFAAFFTDGTGGAFTMNVPTPGAGAAFAVALLAARRRRRVPS